jgi:cysteine desulfurase / selenocysteine lyase
MIYLDNAATSFPKPKETIEHLNRFVTEIGGNPGRSGHSLSVEAARVMFEAREKLTEFIHGDDSERLIFTQNGTESLNLAILGLIKERDHVITTSLEHNSVMRPLMFLMKERGVELSITQCDQTGSLDTDTLAKMIRKDTKAVIINHGSNVIGSTQPIGEIKKVIGNMLLIVDACQTIGTIPIDIEKDNIDIICFSCHKSLFALQGLGALYIRKGLELTPLKFGGTGSKSESVEHPEFLPDKYECGTPNTPGIASLLGGFSFIKNEGLTKISQRKRTLRDRVFQGLSDLDRITVYGDNGKNSVLPVISFNIDGKLPSEVGYILNQQEIYVRVGLQCSPMAHKTIGTFPGGTVRVSPGYFTSDEDIDIFLEAVKKIAQQ